MQLVFPESDLTLIYYYLEFFVQRQHPGDVFAEQKFTTINITHTKTKDTTPVLNTLKIKHRLGIKINTAV